jgi:hypothetical protein
MISSPQDKLEAYLYNGINIEIFEEYEFFKYMGRKEPLDFFNSLFSEFAFFNENIENYLTIKNHFNNFDNNQDYDNLVNNEIFSLNLSHQYEALVKIIREKYPVKLREGVILKSCEYIESTSEFLSSMNYGNEDQMDTILKEIEFFNYNEKIEYLIQCKYISLKKEDLFIDRRGITIASKIDLEIERLGQLKQLKIETNTETLISTEIFNEIDLSNSSAVQKIIYLNELGIIDLLKNQPCFKASVNNLATVLSAITGENIKTLQPILNPMFNKNTVQKNNPYSSKSAVKNVKSQLINLGIQSK